MNKTRTIPFINLLATVIFLYSLTAIIPRLISRYLTTYFYLVVLILCVGLVVLFYGRSLIHEYIAFALPFFAWKALYYFISRPSITNWVYEVLLDFLPIILGLFIIKKISYKSIKYFSIVILLALSVTMITTYFGVIQNPNAARYMATVANSNEAQYVRYNMMNIGGFELVYTTVLLYPVLIYAYKRKKINLFLTLILIAVEFLFIITTAYTTALLLCLASTIFLFFRKNLSVKSLIVIAVLVTVLIVAFSGLFSDGLKALANVIDDESISERLYAVAGGRAGMEATDDRRLELWMLSLNEFLSHPLFGNLSFGGGGHSFFLDNLAKYGLFGGAIIVVILIMIFKKFFLPYKDTEGYGFIVWMFVQVLILMLLNPTFWLYVLCLYIPIFLRFINKESENVTEAKPLILVNSRRVRHRG